ncbi:MAG: isoleucine--tRNA ligase [Bacilli bacterium]
MNYKDTLLMPQTDFEMRGNLPKKEPIMQKQWEEMKIYEQRLNLNSENKPFILHDGPPYANGDLHVGHALNKILKDFIIRSKSMQGMYSPYIPGWDTHGLPIENAIAKTGINRKDYAVSEFRKMCEKYALEQVEIQKASFKEYSIFGNWDNPYITLKKCYEASQIEVFAKMVERGLIYKGLRPVYWSASSESALAEAEIEYKDKKSPAIFVKFPVNGKFKGVDKVNLVIWTTTPWTLPGNMAIAVSENIEYALVKTDEEYLVIAKDLIEDLMKKFNIDNYETIDSFKGSELKGLEYKHVFLDRVSPVIYGEHVSLESGSALVHTAPGHGEEDFLVGKEYNLEILCPVDEKGILTADAGMFAGLHFDDANKAIVNYLEENDYLLNFEMITHSYPHDWRTKKPIIFRATAQWFASIDKIRGNILDEITNNIKWYPKWGETRLYNMIKDRGDWCISRQRVWGVPIPIIYDETGVEILDADLMYHFSRLFEEHGSNIWFDWDVKELLPKNYTHPNSPNGKFTKETDIMDVWFDSGSSHYAVSKEFGFDVPVQLYLEGSDQYRGWFNSSLITSVAINGAAPYETVLSHGMILDGKGYAMSKSLGNTIDPKDLLNQFGTDILRLWVSSVDYQQDTRMSIDVMKQIAESYKKIRNTFRFLSGNLNTLTSPSQLIKYEDMNLIDRYMLHKLNDLVASVINSYNEYEFMNVYKEIMKYITDLSSFYLDYAKDSLYADAVTSTHRLGIQTVLYNIEDNLMKLLTPILPHTMDELYAAINSFTDKKDSVYLENLPEVKSLPVENFEAIEFFFDVRKDVLKSMEKLREEKVIGKSLEAKISLNMSEKQKEMLNSLGSLRELFISSDVVFVDEEIEVVDNYKVKVEKMEGHVCPRCWNVFSDIEELCIRCGNVVESL